MNSGIFYVVEKMERETRIELATNSLEGCDSTIELLPLLTDCAASKAAPVPGVFRRIASYDITIAHSYELKIAQLPQPPKRKPFMLAETIIAPYAV